MGRIVRLTERDLSRIVKRVISEMEHDMMDYEEEDFMVDDEMMGGEMEEGLFGPSKTELAKLKKEFEEKIAAKFKQISDVRKRLFTMDDLANPKKFMSDAEDSDYKGEIKASMMADPNNPDGKPKVVFRWLPEYKWYQKWAMGTGDQVAGK